MQELKFIAITARAKNKMIFFFIKLFFEAYYNMLFQKNKKNRAIMLERPAMQHKFARFFKLWETG